MADELIFYTNPMSRGQIARWMIEETGAPDADYALVEQQFSDQERAELGSAIATMNAFNRLAIGFRLPIPAQRTS